MPPLRLPTVPLAPSTTTVLISLIMPILIPF
jgi:hypothetical protein